MPVSGLTVLAVTALRCVAVSLVKILAVTV